MIAWVSGAMSLTDPAVALALADAGQPAVTALHLATADAGPAPLRPLAVGVSGSVRVVVGEAAAGEPAAAPTAAVIEANVDDLDPRVWPSVLAALLAAGAADAWLTPIAMKKGRPAHTVAALVDDPGGTTADAVRRVLLAQTTTIGLRETAVIKVALARRDEVVHVGGQPVRIKVAVLDGAVVNAMPEWDDVAAAAAALGRPVKQVLAQAHAAAASLWPPPT